MTSRLSNSAFSLILISGIAVPMAGAASGQPMPKAQVGSHASLRDTGPAASKDATKDPSGNVYVVGAGDMLEVDVWNEPDLKQSLPVRSDGKITLPLIGSLQASGKTPSQLEDAITAKLKAYIHNPAVTVIVLQMNSRKFNILGRVAKAGSYPLSATTTVLDAIAEAGGFQDFAKVKDIYILRPIATGGETRIHFNYKAVIKGEHPEQNIVLEPHDTVIVP